jgi:hypothetical protein
MRLNKKRQLIFAQHKSQKKINEENVKTYFYTRKKREMRFVLEFV